MKICLVRPNCDTRFQITPPLSLGYLSSALKKDGYNDIHFVDGALYDLSPSQAYDTVKSKGPFDIIGIQVYTDLHNWAKGFVDTAKRDSSKSIIICGGPHISALKELALKYIGVDYGVIGEGENAIVDFAKYVEGKIKDPREVEGLIFRTKDGFMRAKKEYGFFENPNDIPIPDWDLLEPQEYFAFKQSASLPLRGRRPADILTSRGCPYACTFCASRVTARKMIRFRTPENVITEIKYLIKKFNIDEIFFSDDNLTMDLKRAEKLFTLMIQDKLKVHWRAPNGLRIDRLNEALIKKMAESGAYYVGVGIESGNKDVLKRIKKQIKLDSVPEMVTLLRKNGIDVNGFFMCGMLGETPEEIEDSIKFSLKVPFSRIQVSNYVPYPGSEDFDIIFQADKPELYERDVMKFQESEYMPKFQELTLEQIYKIQRTFMLKFYLRPKLIFSVISKIRFSQVKALLSNPDIKMWFKKEKKWYSA